MGGPFLQVAVWTNRVLSLISIVFCILDFTVGITFLFGIFFAVLAIFVSFMFHISHIYFGLVLYIYFVLQPILV